MVSTFLSTVLFIMIVSSTEIGAQSSGQRSFTFAHALRAVTGHDEHAEGVITHYVNSNPDVEWSHEYHDIRIPELHDALLIVRNPDDSGDPGIYPREDFRPIRPHKENVQS